MRAFNIVGILILVPCYSLNLYDLPTIKTHSEESDISENHKFESPGKHIQGDRSFFIKNRDEFVDILKSIRKEEKENTPEMSDGFQNPMIKSTLENFMKRKFGLAQPLLSKILKNYLIDSNDTDNFIDNLNGAEAFVSEALRVVRRMAKFLEPSSLTSSDHCLADIAAYFQGLSSYDLWALKMLDASGKPSRSLFKGNLRFMGNYEECKKIKRTSRDGQMRSVSGQYWSLIFDLQPNVTHAIFPADQLWLPKKLQLKWDVCLPNSCQKETIMDEVAEHIIPLSQRGFNISDAIAITGKDFGVDDSALAAFDLVMLWLILTLVVTLYDVISDVISEMSKQGSSKTSGEHNSAFVSDDGKNLRRVDMALSMTAMTEMSSRLYPPDELDSDDDDDGPLGSDYDDERPTMFRVVKRKKTVKNSDDDFGSEALLSFSLSRNTEKILNTRTGDSNLGCIHGIRVLSMAWVILGHCNSDIVLSTYENPLDVLEMAKTFAMQSIFAGTLALDTFFVVLSGCLVCYLFLRDTQKSAKGKPTWKQMILYYVHRFWRLTPVYMTVVMFYAWVLEFMVEGPLYTDKHILESHETCRRHWWINILYINNIYKPKEMCLPHSWFLANDMQFYTVAPIVLLPLAFGFPAIGILLSLAMIVVHIVSTVIIDNQLGGATLIINANPEFSMQVYITPWFRVAPFAIGLILGFILYKTKCKAILPKYVQVIGWQVGIAICLLCTYSTNDTMKDGVATWPTSTSLTYETLFRPGWSLFVCWLIFVCVSGYGGFMNSILSWSAWVPLDRLTYGAYLIHPLLLYYTELSQKSLVYFSIVNLSYLFIGTFVVSYSLSFLTCLLVETPCMGLERAVLNKLRMKN